jgi:hypothetical protein
MILIYNIINTEQSTTMEDFTAVERSQSSSLNIKE